MSASLCPENCQAGPRPPLSRRRDKPQLSCMSCRQRKLKCDRNRPCENCTKRSHLCVYPNPTSCNPRDQRQRPPRRSSPHSLQDRIRHLEELVTSLVNNGGNPIGSEFTNPNTAAPNPAQQTEEIADSFGRLVVDESGTNYVGNSHWQTILDELVDVREHLDTSTRPSPETTPSDSSQSTNNGIELFLGVNKNITREEILSSIPPKPEIDRLISRFFQSMELGALIVHKSTFEKQYDLFWQDPSSTDAMWVGLLFGMMCLGSHFYFLAGISEESTEKAELDIKLYRKRCTQCLILGNYTRPQPAALNTLLVYFSSEFMQCEDMDFGLSLLVGTIIHLALRMGYHRDPSHYPHLSVFDGEMRRRTWAVISHLDLMVCVQFGIQRFTNEKLTDTAPPRNLMNHDFDENTTELPPPRLKTETTPVSYTNARTTLLKFLGNVIESIESARQTSYATILKQDNELNQLFESIPPQFKLPKGTLIELPTSIFQRLVIELLYNKTRCLLHKKHFALSDEAYTYSRRTCIDAAMRILKIQSFIHSEAEPGGQFYAQRRKLTLILRQDFMLAAMFICLDLDQESKMSRPPLALLTSDDYPFWRVEDKIKALEYAYKAWERWLSGSKDEAIAIEAVKIVIDKHRTASTCEPLVESDDMAEVHPNSPIPASQVGLSPDLSTGDTNHLVEMLWFPEYGYTMEDVAASTPSNPFTAQTTPLPQFGNHSVDPQQGMEFSADSTRIVEAITHEPPINDWDRWYSQMFQGNTLISTSDDIWRVADGTGSSSHSEVA